MNNDEIPHVYIQNIQSEGMKSNENANLVFDVRNQSLQKSELKYELMKMSNKLQYIVELQQ